jgi:hypothetical protein
MKTPLPLSAVLALLSAVSITPAAEEATVAARFLDPDSPEHAEVRKIGENTINRLAMTLVNEVAVAVAKAGAEKALEVCHLKALPLTGVIIRDTPRITGVKRTSLRLRNPANAPDAAEQLALKRVERDLENGILPKVLLQQIDLPGGKSELRVYRLVGVMPQCVACHGPKNSMSPELQALLKERYPADQATGYAPGSWRGLIRVSVADAPPAPVPAAKKKI